MSVESVQRSCWLKRFEFPNYWEEIIETPASPEKVVARIKELHANYQPKEGEGVSYAIEDDQGNKLHVGCSNDGWVLLHDPKDGAGSIALGNKRVKGHKAFLFPEWTEFERKHLIAPSVAEAVVHLWVDTGQLSQEVEWVE